MMGTRVFEIVCPHRGCGLGARSNEANLTVGSRSTARELLSVVAQADVDPDTSQSARPKDTALHLDPPLAKQCIFRPSYEVFPSDQSIVSSHPPPPTALMLSLEESS